MKMVNAHEAKTRLSALIADIEDTGEQVIICRYGKPIANLVPHRNRSRLEPLSEMSKFWMNYDLTKLLDGDEWPRSNS